MFKYLDAIQWTFGFTKKETIKYYQKHKFDFSLLETILEGYKQHCKNLWAND